MSTDNANDVNPCDKVKMAMAQRAVRAGRDAACVFRSNAQHASLAQQKAEKMIQCQCAPGFYEFAVAAFNREVSRNVCACIVQSPDKSIIRVTVSPYSLAS